MLHVVYHREDLWVIKAFKLSTDDVNVRLFYPRNHTRLFTKQKKHRNDWDEDEDVDEDHQHSQMFL